MTEGINSLIYLIDVLNFNVRMIEFKKFLTKTDYDVLYKASRMDFELLSQELNLKSDGLF